MKQRNFRDIHTQVEFVKTQPLWILVFLRVQKQKNFLVKIAFRILASAPPILGAFFVRELGIITSYAGVLAIVTVLTFPSLLYLESRAEMKRRGIFGPTYYDGWLSSIAGAYMVFVLSVVAGFYILFKLLFCR